MTSQNNNDMGFNNIPISSDTGDALIQPAASSIGNALGTVLDGIFHIVLDPVRKFNIQKEHDLKIFQKVVDNQNICATMRTVKRTAAAETKRNLNNSSIKRLNERNKTMIKNIKNQLIEAFNIWWERRRVLRDMERRDYSVI